MVTIFDANAWTRTTFATREDAEMFLATLREARDLWVAWADSNSGEDFTLPARLADVEMENFVFVDSMKIID